MIDITSLSGTFSSTDSDSSYFYVGGTQGAVVFRKSDSKQVAFGTISGVNDVWAGHQSLVFLATSSGIKTFMKSDEWDETDFSDEIANFRTIQELPSPNVTAIDGISDDYILAGTSSGVILFNGSQSYDSLEFTDIEAVEVADDGTLYYGGAFGLAAKSTTVSGDGFTADYSLNTATVPPIGEVLSIDTTIDGGVRIIAVGTDDGVIIYKEEDILENSPVIQLLR